MSDTNETEVARQDDQPADVLRYSVVEGSTDCPTDLPNALYDHGTLVACHSDAGAAEACAEMMNAAVDMPGMASEDDTGSMQANSQEPPEVAVERGPTTPGKEIVGNPPVELYGTHQPRQPWEL